MALNINNHTFKGHKTLLGSKYVTYGEVELPLRYEIFSKSENSFDWGHNGPASMQLAFSILYQLTDIDTAKEYVLKFTQDVVKHLNSRDWKLRAIDVIKWIDENKKEVTEKESELVLVSKPIKKLKKRKTNVVKSICQELQITQKQLAEILEVPEGTVSSWAVKDEIPRLGKKAIEFYTINTKNQKIVDSYKDFIHLLQAS